MTYKKEYKRWLEQTSGDVLDQLKNYSEKDIEDAFYRNLSFGTGRLRGVIRVGTNR